ncbi:MAG: NUDIX hydrolase [Mariniphaga sp.]|nr:NUDIX hydrolase [Mariniphaga sp.]
MKKEKVNNQVQRTTVKALFHRDGKILLQKDHKGKWEMPGGKIQFGESPKEALRREVKEELGYGNIIINSLVDAWTFNVVVDEIDYQFIVIVFNTESDNYQNDISQEHIDCRWISFDEVKDLNMRDGYKDAINKFRNDNKL